MQGCRQCEQITSGDCGQHGPQFIPLSPPLQGVPLDWKDAEIARLRAEVNRLTSLVPIDPKHPDCVVVLKSGLDAFGADVQQSRAEVEQLTKERDMAVDGWKHWMDKAEKVEAVVRAIKEALATYDR